MWPVPDVESIWPSIMRGKTGQTSDVSLARVLGVQKSRRFRRGDSRTRVLHRRHHEPAIAKPLPLVFVHTMSSYPHKNQIFPVGRHQEVRRFVSPGLHHITSLSHCGMSPRKTYFDFVWFVSSESGNDYFPSAGVQNGNIFGLDILISQGD
jgi:hypothetical protein